MSTAMFTGLHPQRRRSVASLLTMAIASTCEANAASALSPRTVCAAASATRLGHVGWPHLRQASAESQGRWRGALSPSREALALAATRR